jgi:hypothetical protein
MCSPADKTSLGLLIADAVFGVELSHDNIDAVTHRDYLEPVLEELHRAIAICGLVEIQVAIGDHCDLETMQIAESVYTSRDVNAGRVASIERRGYRTLEIEAPMWMLVTSCGLAEER